MEYTQKLINKKNDWLYSQVDVDFPTEESIKGMSAYKAAETERQYLQLTSLQKESGASIEFHKADFHRLTVMFAQLQSFSFPEQQQASVLEFFAQIIFSEAHELYIGFENQNPVCVALLTKDSELTLISDIVSVQTTLNNLAVASQLSRHLEIEPDSHEIWYNPSEK